MSAPLSKISYAGREVLVVDGGDDELYLTDARVVPSGVRLELGRPVRLVLDEQHSALGGHMPGGAVEARAVGADGVHVTGAIGGGVWLAGIVDTLSHRLPPAVAFRDRSGALVAPALPSEWERRPVLDTQSVCPACSAITWEEVTPNDYSRGADVHDGERRPSRVVRCRTCGYEEPLGLRIGYARASSRRSVVSQGGMRRSQQKRGIRHRADLDTLSFDVIVADGWPATLKGVGKGDQGVTRIVLDQWSESARDRAVVEVITAREIGPSPNVAALVRHKLASLLGNTTHEIANDASPSALVLASHARERASYRDALAAVLETHEIVVDDVATSFTYVRHGEQWVAGAAIDRRVVTVSSALVGINSVRLSTLRHPAQALLVDTDPDERDAYGKK